MDYFFTLIKDNKEAVGFIVIISGGIGFFLNYFLARKKIKEDKKALRQQMITNNIAPMRQEWINDIRGKATKFLSLLDYIALYKNSYYSDNEDWKNRMKKVYDDNTLLADELYLYLLVALPFSREEKKEELADEIRSRIKQLYGHLQYGNKMSDDEYDKTLTDIHSCLDVIKLLLKKEWEETKSLKEIEEDTGIIKKITNSINECFKKQQTQ